MGAGVGLPIGNNSGLGATVAVPQLANALFREFPGTPGVTTQVRLN